MLHCVNLPGGMAILHGQDIRIFADVHVKHGAQAITADRSIAELARDVEFFDADIAIATGQRTGDFATMAELETIASYLKQEGVWWNPVDPARLRTFMQAADRARE